MKTSIILLFGLALMALLACSPASQAQQSAKSPFLVTTLEGRALIESNQSDQSMIVLDVRTPEEFAAGHLPGAINISIADPAFGEKIGALDKQKPTFIYCRTQNRSAHAAQMMKQAGFTDLRVMNGGFSEWQGKGYPVENPM